MNFARKILGTVLTFLERGNRVDPNYYYDCYPDVAESGLAAEVHYRLHGWREGRNPSANFHSMYYATRHLPGGKLSENPLAHYMAHGGALSGRETSPYATDDWVALQKQLVAEHFDEIYYRKNYNNQIGDHAAIDHYFAIGWKTRCNPCAHFDTHSYLDRNAHILRSDINPLLHYVLSEGARAANGAKPEPIAPQLAPPIPLAARGKFKGNRSTRGVAPAPRRARAPAGVPSAIRADFDAGYYVTQYRDVAAAGIDPLLHFVEYGWREGRNPSPLFQTRYYQALYGKELGPDVNPLYHYVTVGRQKAYRPNPIGRERWPRPTAPDAAAWGRVVPAADNDAEVHVIVPVYRGYDDTLATIHSVLTQPQNTRFCMSVINDCSPDAALTEKLRELSCLSLFTYLENEQNLGFIGSVNRCLDLLPQLDVILLNADTLVFGDWIDRILAHARADSRIGTITPYSNNATICSYPDPNCDNIVSLECSLAQLDASAAACNRGRETQIPTGVGFCMYMRRAAICEIGGLDPAFGRGYGEENDFCMRAIKAGYTNILAEDVVVFHSGRVSFSEIFAEEHGAGQKLLTGKHPDYSRRVAEYVQSDPGRTSRTRLDLYRLARHMGDKVALFVTINGSGGVVTHVDILARRLEAAGIVVLIAHVDGDVMTFQPFDRKRDIYTPSLKQIDLCFDASVFGDFLNWLQPSIIHLHSLALASWRASEAVMRLCGPHRERLYVTLHDYDALCYRHHLVDAEGRYCEKPDLRKCVPCVQSATAQNRCDPSSRTAAWRAFLGSARRVFVPSADARDRLTEAFPDVDFAVREHEEELDAVSPLPPPDPAEPLRLVSIGAIGPHKGSNLIYSLALDAHNRRLPIEYHILGYTAIDTDMKKIGVSLSGRYLSTEDCIKRLRLIRPSFALFLSIWPETYCYALSLAMAHGVPPIVFDLGAQAARTRAAGFGVVLDPKLVCDPGAINDVILALSRNNEWAKVRPVHFRTYDRFPFDYYDLPEGETGSVAEPGLTALGPQA